MTVQVGDLFQSTVYKLIFGGLGLVRLKNGMVAHVPYVIPQENIFGKIDRLYKSYAVAHLVECVDASPDRITPRCAHFGVCGGCQLQHIQYGMHESIKKGWLQESLSSCIPNTLEIEWSSSNSIWEWRKKSVFHASRMTGELLFGYFARDSQTLLSCHECPIFFNAQEKEVISLVKQALSQCLRWKKGDVVFFRRPFSQVAVHFFLDGTFQKAEKESLMMLLSSSPHIEEVTERGDVLFSKKKDSLLSFQFHDITFQYSEKAFIQTHPEQPFFLWQDFVTHMKLWKAESSFLDLYSGIGVTAVLAAQQKHKVTAVELSQEAVDACMQTAKREGLITLRSLCKSVESFLSSKAYLQKEWDSILINPPRKGLAPEVLESMTHAKARELHYISCHPATLRRDLIALCRGGWTIVWVKGYDMFPQTSHFETYVKLRREEGFLHFKEERQKHGN